jgi:hypothetical protein
MRSRPLARSSRLCMYPREAICSGLHTNTIALDQARRTGESSHEGVPGAFNSITSEIWSLETIDVLDVVIFSLYRCANVLDVHFIIDVVGDLHAHGVWELAAYCLVRGIDR